MLYQKKEHYVAKPFTDIKLPKFFSAKRQKTLTKPLIFKGIGLHTGNSVTMKLSSAPSDTGIVFRKKVQTNHFRRWATENRFMFNG